MKYSFIHIRLRLERPPITDNCRDLTITKFSRAFTHLQCAFKRIVGTLRTMVITCVFILATEANHHDGRGQSSSVGLVIRGSLVRFLARALWSVLGQDSLFYIASVYPAAIWVPSMNKAVLRACAIYTASCSGIYPGGLKWFPCVHTC